MWRIGSLRISGSAACRLCWRRVMVRYVVVARSFAPLRLFQAPITTIILSLYTWPACLYSKEYHPADAEWQAVIARPEILPGSENVPEHGSYAAQCSLYTSTSTYHVCNTSMSDPMAWTRMSGGKMPLAPTPPRVRACG